MSATTVISLLWCQIALILGLLGNSYVLFATISHNAIKLDKVSIWIIQNLAVADIANCVMFILPVIITLYARGEWVLGDTFCGVFFVYKYSCLVANMILMNLLSLNKLMRCLFPLRSLSSSRRQRYLITAVTAFGSAVLPAWSFYGTVVAKFLIVEFSASQCTCWSVYTEDAAPWTYAVGYAMAGVLNAVPCVTLVLMNIFLVAYALKKTNRTVNKMNILIVVLVTTIFVIPMLPYFICYILFGNEWDEGLGTIRFITFIMFVSSFANPLIYLLTNKGFKQFTKGILSKGYAESVSVWSSFRVSYRTNRTGAEDEKDGGTADCECSINVNIS